MLLTALRTESTCYSMATSNSRDDIFCRNFFKCLRWTFEFLTVLIGDFATKILQIVPAEGQWHFVECFRYSLQFVPDISAIYFCIIINCFLMFFKFVGTLFCVNGIISSFRCYGKFAYLTKINFWKVCNHWSDWKSEKVYFDSSIIVWRFEK